MATTEEVTVHCEFCKKWHSGNVCPEFVVTQEQRDAIKDSEAAMQGVTIRESVRRKIDKAWGIDIDTFKSKCFVCAKDGIWVVGAPQPLICGKCQDTYVEMQERLAVEIAENEGMA